jgi:putative glutathione S-transferase
MAQFQAETSQDGAFKRQQDGFRQWVTADGRSGFPVAAGRYHLYVSWACPWAHRTIIARRLLGLETAIGLTAVDPVRDEQGWAFRKGDGFDEDPINGFAYLSEAYRATDPSYRAGRYTVPVLWDKETGRIVSNSDDDILRMFGTEFTCLYAAGAPDLYPEAHRAEIDRLNDWIFTTLNDGVYQAGFAESQGAYEAGARKVFATLDALDGLLADRRYLVTGHPVESDWRLFVTLVRFDAVYHGHFKCNVRRIVDYPHLWGYLRDLWQIPGVADTVKLDQIKRHYYFTHDDLNPSRIIPIGPALDFTTPPGREALGG